MGGVGSVANHLLGPMRGCSSWAWLPMTGMRPCLSRTPMFREPTTVALGLWSHPGLTSPAGGP